MQLSLLYVGAVHRRVGLTSEHVSGIPWAGGTLNDFQAARPPHDDNSHASTLLTGMPSVKKHVEKREHEHGRVATVASRLSK